MPAVTGPVASRVAGAAARTVAAGTARLLAAWCTGSPLPGAADRRCEGVADLAARRARVSQSMFFTDGLTATLIERGDDDRGLGERVRQTEMIYHRANAYVWIADRWTRFFLADPGRPRGPRAPPPPLHPLLRSRNLCVQIRTQTEHGATPS